MEISHRTAPAPPTQLQGGEAAARGSCEEKQTRPSLPFGSEGMKQREKSANRHPASLWDDWVIPPLYTTGEAAANRPTVHPNLTPNRRIGHSALAHSANRVNVQRDGLCRRNRGANLRTIHRLLRPHRPTLTLTRPRRPRLTRRPMSGFHIRPRKCRRLAHFNLRTILHLLLHHSRPGFNLRPILRLFIRRPQSGFNLRPRKRRLTRRPMSGFHIRPILRRLLRRRPAGFNLRPRIRLRRRRSLAGFHIRPILRRLLRRR